LVGLKILDVREHVRKDGNVGTVVNVGKDGNVEKERNVENVNGERGLTSYVSSSWNLCRRISNQNLFLQGDVVFSQDLERQAPVNKLKSYIIIIIVNSFIFHFITLQKKSIMVILILDK